MKKHHDITIAFRNEMKSNNPNYEKLKEIIIQVYNNDNNKSIDIENVSTDEQKEIIRWFNTQHHFFPLTLLRKEVITHFFSQSLSTKISALSQYHCPICTGNKGVATIFNIRISAISKQAMSSRPEYREAFERAIFKRFESKDLTYKKGDKLCVSIVFVLGCNNRDKDLDNMSKALMDALEGNLFENDMDIVHSNLIKIKTEEPEDYITVNIRETEINEHKDVLFKTMAHGWAGQEFLNLEDFIKY